MGEDKRQCVGCKYFSCQGCRDSVGTIRDNCKLHNKPIRFRDKVCEDYIQGWKTLVHIPLEGPVKELLTIEQRTKMYMQEKRQKDPVGFILRDSNSDPVLCSHCGFSTIRRKVFCPRCRHTIQNVRCFCITCRTVEMVVRDFIERVKKIKRKEEMKNAS